MGIALSGYVLEGAKVAPSNAKTTFSPDILKGSGFSYFPHDESLPEHGYALLCTLGEKLPYALFGWVRNDLLRRFDFDGKRQSCYPIAGENRQSIGKLQPTGMKVLPPVSDDLTSYPLRITVGGHTPSVAVVGTFSGSPPPDTVEVLLLTGELAWSADILTNYPDAEVWVQNQTFRGKDGLMGQVSPDLYLSPIPATGQVPLLRFDQNDYLTAIEVPNEGSFPILNPGEVAWARDTGRLAFEASVTDVEVFYDGVLNDDGLSLPWFFLGTVSGQTASAPLSPVPPPGGDIIVRVGTTYVPETRRVDTLSPTVPFGVIEVDNAGTVKFSPDFAATHQGESVIAVPCDLEVEHGVIFRLFRNLKDPSLADSNVLDVTSHVTVTNQKWAEPIGPNPILFPPTIPLEDWPTTMRIVQGNGSYLDPDFPRLDKLGPGDPYQGLGYFWAQGFFTFGIRRRNQIVTLTGAALELPDSTLQAKGLYVEEETAVGSGVYQPLTLGEDAILEPGVLVPTARKGQRVLSRSGTLTGNTLEDLAAPFSVVQSNDFVTLHDTLYQVTAVLDPSHLSVTPSAPTPQQGLYEVFRNSEVIADRVWFPVPVADPLLVVKRTRSLGTVTNSPRLVIDDKVHAVFSFSDNTTSTSLTLVTTFTNPALLPPLEVEINALGELNFSTAKLGLSVTVTQQLPYRVTPQLGFFDCTIRFFKDETGTVTYRDPSLATHTEPIGFLHRKVTLPHPSPTNRLTITNKTLVAPQPKVYRNGRPQTLGKDYTLDGNDIVFLPSQQKTKAFPAGIPIQPTETVMVDFYTAEAEGGEKTFTTLNPIYSPPITTTLGATTLVLPGDASPYLGSHLRLDRTEVTEITNVSVGVDSTTVTVKTPFRETRNNPTVESVDPLSLAFVPVAFQQTPRGSQTLKFLGNPKIGSVLTLKNGTVEDSYLVTGYNDGEVTLGLTLLHEVDSTWQAFTAKVVEPGTRSFNLESSPVSEARAFLNHEKIKVDGSGRIESDFQRGDVLRAFYLGQRQAAIGLTYRLIYVATITPSDANGLLEQKLRADFTIRNWDSFYSRVVPISKFKEEVNEELFDSGGGGPITENVGGATLPEKGKPGLFWLEHHLENADIAARAYLLYYHGLCDALDDVIEKSYGIKPGLHDGRFRFDGMVNNAPSVRLATNQIDDWIEILPGIKVPAYLSGSQSRFFPTYRHRFGLSLNTTTEGAPILDLGARPIQGVAWLRTRLPWAQVQGFASSTSSTVTVEDTAGGGTRPGFAVNMKCVIQAEDGTFIKDADHSLEVSSFTATTITFTTPIGADVPAGASVYRSPRTDTAVLPYVRDYRADQDYGIDFQNGVATYRATFPPFDGSPPFNLPDPICIHPIPSNTLHSWDISLPVLNNAPERFPALDGVDTDDDGETPMPVLSPSVHGEINSLQVGLLEDELNGINRIQSLTYPTSAYIVDIDPTGTVLTLTSGTWPSPGPRALDLVRFLSGVNESTTYYPVSIMTPTTATLATAVTGPESGVTVTFTEDDTLPSTCSASGIFLNDPTASFSSDDVGRTIVLTGYRRRIMTVTSPNDLTMDWGVPPLIGAPYRVSKALATYSNVTKYSNVVADLQTLYSDLDLAFQAFFTTLFDVQYAGVGMISMPDRIDDGSADYSLLQPPPTTILVPTGPNRGVYAVDTVLNPTALTITTNFQIFEAAANYQVVTTNFQGDYSPVVIAWFAARDAAINLNRLHDLLTQQVPVSGQPLSYATAVLSDDLTQRISEIGLRKTEVANMVTAFQGMLSTGLYSSRYAWIFVRIHRVSGLLSRIAAERVQRQETLTRLKLGV